MSVKAQYYTCENHIIPATYKPHSILFKVWLYNEKLLGFIKLNLIKARIRN